MQNVWKYDLIVCIKDTWNAFFESSLIKTFRAVTSWQFHIYQQNVFPGVKLDKHHLRRKTSSFSERQREWERETEKIISTTSCFSLPIRLKVWATRCSLMATWAGPWRWRLRPLWTWPVMDGAWTLTADCVEPAVIWPMLWESLQKYSLVHWNDSFWKYLHVFTCVYKYI